MQSLLQLLSLCLLVVTRCRISSLIGRLALATPGRRLADASICNLITASPVAQSAAAAAAASN